MARTALDTTGTTHSLKAGGDLINEMTQELYDGDHIHDATAKATPVDGDEFGLQDSAASFVRKKTLWSSIKATLKTYFDTLYALALGSIYIQSGSSRTAYGSIASALAAAVPGDIIYVGPGNYTITANTSIIADGLTWVFAKGAVLTQTAAQGDTTSMLKDASGAECSILGHGRFVLDRTGNGSTKAVLSVTVASMVAGDYFSIFHGIGNGHRNNYYVTVEGVGNPPTGRIQVNTLTVTATITTAGDGKVTMESDLMNGGTAFDVGFAVLEFDDATAVAASAAAALQANGTVNALYAVTSSGADIIFTRLAKAANDATFTAVIADDTCAGISSNGASITTEGAADLGIGGTDYELAMSTGYSNADVINALIALGSGVALYTFGTPSGGGATVEMTAVVAELVTTPATSSAHSSFSVTTLGTTMSFLNLLSSVSGSDLTVEFEELTLTFNGLLEPADATANNLPSVVYQNGPMKIRGRKITGSGDNVVGLTWINGETTNDVTKIEGGYAGVWSNCRATPTGDFYLNSEIVYCTASTASAKGWPFWASGNQSSARLWLNVKVWKHPGHAAGTASEAMALYSSGNEKVYFGYIQKLYGGYYCLGGEYYAKIDKISPVRSGMQLMYGTGDLDVGIVDHNGLSLSGIAFIQPVDPAPGRLRIGYYKPAASMLSGSAAFVNAVHLINSHIDLSNLTNKSVIGNGGSASNCVLISTGTGVDATNATLTGCRGSGTNGHVRTSGCTMPGYSHTLKTFTTTGSSTGTNGTSYNNLMALTTTASCLGATGDALRAEFYVQTVAHASNTRQIRIKFAGTVIYDSGAVATAAAAYGKLEVTIIRTGSTTARALVSMSCNHLTLVDSVTETDLTGLTFTNTNDLALEAVAGTGGAAADIIAKMGKIVFEAAGAV